MVKGKAIILLSFIGGTCFGAANSIEEANQPIALSNFTLGNYSGDHLEIVLYSAVENNDDDDNQEEQLPVAGITLNNGNVQVLHIPEGDYLLYVHNLNNDEHNSVVEAVVPGAQYIYQNRISSSPPGSDDDLDND